MRRPVWSARAHLSPWRFVNRALPAGAGLPQTSLARDRQSQKRRHGRRTPKCRRADIASLHRREFAGRSCPARVVRCITESSWRMSDNGGLRVVPEASRNVGLPTAGRRGDQALECESLERPVIPSAARNPSRIDLTERFLTPQTPFGMTGCGALALNGRNRTWHGREHFVPTSWPAIRVCCMSG